MTPYINPAFRERQEPVALLPGTVEDPEPVYRGPGMSPEFRARGQAFIEAQSRDMTPESTRSSHNDRHIVFCILLAFPVCFAIMAAFFGDMRLCAILCLIGMAEALVGLFILDGPA